MEILQYTDKRGKIHDKGLIRICLTKECTASTGSGALFAEIILTERETGGAGRYYWNFLFKGSRNCPFPNTKFRKSCCVNQHKK